MKKKLFFSVIIIIFAFISIQCFESISFAASNEDKALDEVAQAMLLKADKLKGKRIGIFKFTSLEGKESPEGARISQCILERLMKNDSLTFVDRSELKKIVGEQELQQSGLVDPDLVSETGKVLPIDYMITGTFVYIKTKGHISARILKAATGEIYIAKSTEYVTETQKESSKDSKEAIEIYKASPDKLDRLNRVFYNLMEMSEKRPYVFLVTVINDKEFEQLEKRKPKFAERIKKRRLEIRWEKPGLQMKIDRLRDGLTSMKKMYPSRYEQVMQKKKEMIANPPARKPPSYKPYEGPVSNE